MIMKIKELAQKIHPEVVAHRRYLHAHPELSFEEMNTSKYIKQFLKKNNISFTEGLADGNGIVAQIGEGERVLALRADIDALPIQEENEVNYKSINNGIMHACGHDVHTSSLMGTILILKELEEFLNITVKFFFQPGEERLPGGASLMIRDGVLTNPTVDAIFGQHVHPSLPVGKIGIKAGSFMASCDEIFITIIGKGGHGAMPHETIDPILISSEVIIGLQSIVSRNANPNIASVLSIGKINSEGGATNVIPAKVHMEGTFRTFNEEWRKKAHELIEKRVNKIVESYNANAVVKIVSGYPALINDEELTNRAKSLLIDYMGEANIVDLPQRMTAEDFSYYSQQVPACFYRLGTASIDGSNSSPVHTATFDIDEVALEHSIGCMAWLALNY